MTDIGFTGTGHFSRTVRQKETLPLQVFKKLAAEPYMTAIHYSGSGYTNEFRLSEMELLLDYETPTNINDDNDDNTDGGLLAKPTATFSTMKQVLDASEPLYQTTITVIVNREPEGRLMIDGFTELLCYVLQNEVFRKLWMEFSLLPRNFAVSRVADGEELVPELENRVLMQSVRVTFSYLGVTNYDS